MKALYKQFYACKRQKIRLNNPAFYHEKGEGKRAEFQRNRIYQKIDKNEVNPPFVDLLPNLNQLNLYSVHFEESMSKESKTHIILIFMKKVD